MQINGNFRPMIPGSVQGIDPFAELLSRLLGMLQALEQPAPPVRKQAVPSHPPARPHHPVAALQVAHPMLPKPMVPTPMVHKSMVHKPGWGPHQVMQKWSAQEQGKVLFEDNFEGPNGAKLDSSKYELNSIDKTGRRRQVASGENAVQDENNTRIENGYATAFVSRESSKDGKTAVDYKRGGMTTRNFSFKPSDYFKKGQSVEIDFRGQHANTRGVKDDLLWLTPAEGTNTSDGRTVTEVDLAEDHAGTTGHAWSTDWKHKTQFNNRNTADIDGMATYKVILSQDKKTGLAKLWESVTYQDKSGHEVTKTYAQKDGQGVIKADANFYLRMLSQEVECKWPGQKIDAKAKLGLGSKDARSSLDYVKVSTIPAL